MASAPRIAVGAILLLLPVSGAVLADSSAPQANTRQAIRRMMGSQRALIPNPITNGDVGNG